MRYSYEDCVASTPEGFAIVQEVEDGWCASVYLHDDPQPIWTATVRTRAWATRKALAAAHSFICPDCRPHEPN